MLESFGPLWYLSGFSLFFRNLRMDDHSAERVRKAALRGPVVFALHTESRIDWLALNRVLLDRRLPLPVCANGVTATPFMPLGQMWRTLREAWSDRSLATDPIQNGQTLAAILAGQPVCVFLAPRRDLRDVASLLDPGGRDARERNEEFDPVRVLWDAQTQTERPVQVLPVVVIWDRAPEPARTEVGRFLLGTEDRPGALGKIRALARSQGGGIVQVGEPVVLSEQMTVFAGETEQRRARALRLVLRRYLYRESLVVKGPRSRPRGWVRKQVLQSREVRDLIRREAAATGKTEEAVVKKIVRTFDHIAAQFSYPVVRMSAFVTRQIWNRIYSGVDVREVDIERIRAALRTGTPILAPCHRSHLDYLLISSLLHDNDVVIPHIVAGENLSFWPLGAIFRRCGAFFIKRSFTGDRIFPVVFERYVRELVRMAVPLEFFIEGGRSRTGKLLPPKLGVMAMVFDAAPELRADQEVTILPIYIGYEQIAEERVYARELAGAGKKKEDMGQVVKATSVLFKRYGKVYLRVGEPLTIKDALARSDTTVAAWPGLGAAERHEALEKAAELIQHRINAEALALPTAIVALALLGHPRAGVRHAELVARIERIREFLAAAGVREGGGASHVGAIIEEAVARFVSGRLLVRLEAEQDRVYRIVPEGRTSLEYYKNTVLHAFAPAAYVASALRAIGSDAVDQAEVQRLFRMQQFLLRHEFVLDPGLDTAGLEARGYAELVAYGALAVDSQGVHTVVDRARVGEIANLTANFLESYLLVLRAADRAARGAGIDGKTLARDAMAFGKTLLAVDEIYRPEALSTQNLENAVRAFREEGVLTTPSGGGHRLQIARESFDAWVQTLNRLLLTPARDG